MSSSKDIVFKGVGELRAFEIAGPYLERVRELLRRHVDESDEKVREIFGGFDICGGKLIRPAVCILSGLCIGGVGQEHLLAGSVLEMIHNATLLHDDVIDEGKIRRGCETINSRYGNETAVLLGDMILCRVFWLCMEFSKEIQGIIADTASRICHGEIRQIIERENWQISERDYVDIIGEKTASLFGSCILLGAKLSGAGAEESNSLRMFGYNMGIAFQMTDDILDLTGSEKKTGKTLGTDALKNKITLPVIHLLSKVSGSEREDLVLKLSDEESDTEWLAARLEREGSFEYSFAQVKGYIDQAGKSLYSVKESDAKNGLVELVNYLLKRTS